jgi:hypothetical protein
MDRVTIGGGAVTGVPSADPASVRRAKFTKMLGWDVAGFADIHATALNAAINGSIFAVPEACFVMTMALPFGSTRALPTAHAISAWPP